MSRNHASKARSGNRSSSKRRFSSSTNQKKLPQGSIECEILRLGHDGRGIAKLGGKTQFVSGALPGEIVKARYIAQRAKFDELKAIEIINASDERVKPPCAHVETCGGCSLQHMNSAAQIQYKQNVLKEQFEHFGNILPKQWLDPILSPDKGYRSKARLSVFFDNKQNRVLLGFREKRNRKIADIDYCHVLDERISTLFEPLRNLIASLSAPKIVTHLEMAAGDKDTALLVRHVKLFADNEIEKFIEFARMYKLDLYFQPGSPETVHRIWPERRTDKNGADRLSYCLEGKKDNSLELRFHPKDFTQINLEMNAKMVQRAIECLDLQKNDRVLDLFCGLGNFTLPMARYVKEVVGVEGSESMVRRGFENAKHNQLDNASFFCADLQSDFTQAKWAKQGFDKILIDPPRSGALDVVNYLSHFKAKRVVYISCNPATLARDSGVLLESGYTLSQAGVMDMFPHTAHVESIALFDRCI